MENSKADGLEKVLKRRDAELATMVEIGKTLTSTLKLEEVLNVIMEQVSRLLKPTAWSLLLKDSATGGLVYEIAVPSCESTLKGTRLESVTAMAVWVAECGKPLLIADLRQDNRVSSCYAGVMAKSAVCVPLMSQDRTLGVIELINSHEDRCFSNADQVMLTTIADFAAIAIENAWAHEKLNQLAVTDELTGLWNARRFNEMLTYEVERSKRYGAEMVLIFLDLDHFKSVNDTHGHLVGSRLLAEIGRLFGRSIRKIDIASRFGGDEFVLMFPNTSREWGRFLAERLCRLLREAQFQAPDGSLIQVTGSFGVASFPADASSPIELIALADKAMYRVKEVSRDGVALASQSGGEASDPGIVRRASEA